MDVIEKTTTLGSAIAKPKMRGWLHTVATPIILLAGITLVVFAPSLTNRIGSAIYLLSALMMFGTSAVYHRGNWSKRLTAVFRRWDHSNIFIFIAGTYTPLCLTMLTGTQRIVLLSLVWGIAACGVVFRVLWLGAPRWLYSMLYVGMGWVAIGWFPAFWSSGGPTVVLLVIAGGIIYSLGAVAYATKRPNLFPRWFGFHEIFHLCTVLAAACHYVAISIAVFTLN